MVKRLSRNFYTQKTLKVAQELLGKFIIRKIGGKERIGMIVETEAYIGPDDRASHARGGKRTPRNEAEFMVGGHIYIYLVYGMYWQLNISTSAKDQPECILIRALEPVRCVIPSEVRLRRTKSRDLINLANGPGKLCRWLKVDKSFYAKDLVKSKKIWLEDWGVQVKKSDIIASPRIGIDYAGPVWAKKPWRFYIRDNEFVSKTIKFFRQIHPSLLQ